MKELFEQVAEARRKQDELLEEQQPRLMEALAQFFGHMLDHQLRRLQLRLADEAGLRHAFFLLSRLEGHRGVFRGRVAWKGFASPPIFQCELFQLDDDSVQLGGVTKAMEPPDVVELAQILDDVSHHDRHAKVEATPDSLVILLKVRTH